MSENSGAGRKTPSKQTKYVNKQNNYVDTHQKLT